MSSPWIRTAARMTVSQFFIVVRRKPGAAIDHNHPTGYSDFSSLAIALRADDQLTCTTEFKVGQWVLTLYRGGTLISRKEYGTETTCRSKAKRWVSEQLSEMRPTYAAEESKLTYPFILRGWEVR